MKKFLVTGGAGFIGSNIVDELLSRGFSVRVLDNFSTGKKENLFHCIDKIELIKGDITDYQTCLKAVKGIDYVIHQAASISVPGSIKDPISNNRNNIDGTLNLLSAAAKEKVRQFVFASSCAVYGFDPRLPKKEDMKPDPRSPYAVSKLAGEYYCKLFNDLFGLPTVALRYFNVYGKRQNAFSEYAAVIPKFISAVLGKKAPRIYGDGKQSRDFVSVSDVARANVSAALSKKAAGEVINVGSGKEVNLLTILRSIKQELDSDISPEHLQKQAGDILHSLSDITKAKKLLGFKPGVIFKEGIKDTINWFRS